MDNSKSIEEASKDESPRLGKKGESSKPGKDSQAVDLYCTIYPPQFGNYYHWAFAMNQGAKKRWETFQVVQEEEDGPYIRNRCQVDPRNSSTCPQPVRLIFLGQMHAKSWDWLIEAIQDIPVPGEAASWNCQDYVLEMWALLLEAGEIDDATWSYSHNLMLPYYGPDFGGQEEHHLDEYEEEEAEEQDGEDGGERKVLSEEFVYDSDDAE
ncbi:hypothetical protein E4U49_003361 [Claviceps purpurea]|nr:hypothetical protein E4U49_003361 [Claviceps purpurea]